MFKLPYFLLSALGILIIVGCEKKDAVETAGSVTVAETKFEPCDCQTNEEGGSSSEYIKADIENNSVCFDVRPNFNDTFPNMLTYGALLRRGGEYHDNLHMIRNSKNSALQAAIFLENSRALTNSYPYTIPGSNPENTAMGELQLNNLDNYVSCFTCPENKFNFLGKMSTTGVKMTVYSFKDNFFEGTFEGIAINGIGQRINIKNGQFRIRLTVYKADIN